jgi:hypothetical protein
VFVLVVAVVGGLLAGLLLGGSLAHLERLSLRLGPLVVIALILQLVAFSPLGDRLPGAGVVALHLVSYALLLTFVFANVRRRAVVCFGAGVICNTVAIVVNGGYMPASRAALRFAGLPVATGPHNNSELAGAATRLGFLGDVFALPHAVPLANVFSGGDVLIAVGLAWLIAAGMRGDDAVATAPVTGQQPQVPKRAHSA